MTSDQGSQYTSFVWTSFLEKKDIKISMDGKGRATDNAWIERFWRTIKKNYLYLNPAETGTDLYRRVDHYITYYNNRYHQGIKAKTNVLYGQESIPLALAS
jgi:putative transposase